MRSIVVSIALSTIASSGCSPKERPEAIWLDGGRGHGEVVYPRAIAYDAKNDWFYVVDRTARVQRIDADGKFLGGWRMPEWELGKPVGLTVGPDGNLWIPDTHYHRVMVYSPDGKLLKQFGEEGEGAGEFFLPTDIAFDSSGNIYVAEYGGNDRIQVFDPDFNFIRSFGHYGREADEFARPQSIEIVNDELFVADSCNHRILVLDLEGKLKRTLGKSGSQIGEFRFPYGMTVGPSGEIYVCEFGGTRVQKFSKDGQPLAIWGRQGKLPGELNYPWGIALDKRGRLVIVDAGNNRLQVIRL